MYAIIKQLPFYYFELVLVKNGRNRVKVLIHFFLTPPGFEPGLCALKGRRVSQFHYGAIFLGVTQLISLTR